MSSSEIPYSEEQVQIAVHRANWALDGIELNVQEGDEEKLKGVNKDDFFAFTVAVLVSYMREEGCEDMPTRVSDAVYRYSGLTFN